MGLLFFREMLRREEKKKSLTSQQNVIRMEVHRSQRQGGGMVSRQRKQALPGQEPGKLGLNDGFAGPP